MNILGIETSCDETAASVVKNGCDVLSNVIVSSLNEHSKYGGIIPEIASRRQMECINSVVEQSLIDANSSLKKIDAIAYTAEPGLIGSLLVGISFAKALSLATQKPLIPVNHIKAHVYASFLKDKASVEQFKAPQLPCIGLVVSGGHSNLYHIKTFKDFTLLGQTRDDAIGEAYDKVARLLKLGYPGGPVIDRLAKNGKPSNIQFTCAQLPGSLDFSFSGIKTAVLYYQLKNKRGIDYSDEDICFAFQQSVIETIVKKSLAACTQKNCKTLIVGGGVAANSYLRKQLSAEAKNHHIEVYFPPMKLCTDNAAMIAGLGYHWA